MGFPTEKRATYADLFDLPETLVGEIINGRLVTHPRPAPKHALVYSTLGFALGGPFHQGQRGPGGWWILDEPEVHIDLKDDHVVNLSPFDAISFPLSGLWAD